MNKTIAACYRGREQMHLTTVYTEHKSTCCVTAVWHKGNGKAPSPSKVFTCFYKKNYKKHGANSYQSDTHKNKKRLLRVTTMTANADNLPRLEQ